MITAVVADPRDCSAWLGASRLSGQPRGDVSSSQSGRRSADVLTRNRPDARIEISLAKKKAKIAKRRGLVSIIEKTK